MLLFPSRISEHVLNENTYTERNIPMEKLFTRKEAATMLGISLATLDTARKDGSIQASELTAELERLELPEEKIQSI